MGSRARDSLSFVSVRRVANRPQRLIARGVFGLLGAALAVTSMGCGDRGFFPTTVDPGPDFAVADIVFDQNYFYCKVEPVLFANSCGSGDPSKGDPRAAATTARRPIA